MKRPPRRVGALELLGNVLVKDTNIRVPSAIETAPLGFRDWELAVGSRIAARARPIRLDDRGVLLVRAATSTWAQELTMLGDTILEQLRARGLRVEGLRFCVGPVDAPARPPSRDEVYVSPAPVTLPAELRREVQRIEDPELRRAIARAAAKNLGWQAALEAPPKAPQKAAHAPKTPSVPAPAPRRDAVAAVANAATPAPSAPRATSAPRGAPAPRAAGSRSARSAPAPTPPPAGRRGRP